MKKTFLFLAALAVSVSLSAEKITTLAGITSGNKYYVGATTGGNDFYFYVDGSAKTESIKGVAKEDVADAVALTFTAVTDGWTIQFESGLYLGLKNAKDNGAVQVMETPVVWTIDEVSDKNLLKLHPNTSYSLQKNNSGTQFGSYGNTQTNVWLESAGAAPVLATLEGIVIKGEASKLEYFVGEAFDPAGLEVWGIYTKTVKGDSTSQITSGITWTIDPEVLAKEDISVDVTAQYKDFTSEVFTVNNIVVKEKPAAKYVPVAWNEIEDGGKYFITANNDGEYYFAAKAFAAKGALAIAFDATLAPEADMWTFTKNGDAWKISAADGAGLYVTATNNGIVCAKDKGADFTAAQGSSAEFTKLTASDGEANRDICLYNKQDFRCYTSTSTSGIHDLKLYGLKKEGVVTKPIFTPAESEFDGSVEVTLTADEGAAIYYTLDATTPTDASTKYESAFTLTATTTIKAIAVKDGKSSEVAEKTYTLIPAFESLEALVTNLPATDKNVTVIVTITEAKIDSFYVSGKYTNGVFTHVGETIVELYAYDVPEAWQVGGTLSATTLKAQWGLYKGTAELQKWEDGWTKFTYTAPAGPGTNLNNLNASKKAVKQVVNGQIVIVRDGKAYNVLGF
mgnify:CR=1 FL=1